MDAMHQPTKPVIAAAIQSGAAVGWACCTIASALLGEILMLRFYQSSLERATRSSAADDQGTQYILDQEPFSAKYPVPFIWLSFSAMTLLLPLRFALRRAVRALNFRSAAVKEDTDENRSLLHPYVASWKISDQDFVDVGAQENAPSNKLKFVLVAPVAVALLLQSICWKLSLDNVAVPVATSLQYVFLFTATGIGALLLKEAAPGFKALACLISFVGTCLFFFPSKTAVREEMESTANVVMGGLWACSSGFLFSIYLVGYRLLNPPGSLSQIVGLEGAFIFIFGWPIVLLAQRYSTAAAAAESATLYLFPRSWSDGLSVVLHGLFRSTMLICANGTLRWADPLLLTAALPCVPPLAYIIEWKLSVGFSFSVVKTIAGCLIIAMFILSSLHTIIKARATVRRVAYSLV